MTLGPIVHPVIVALLAAALLVPVLLQLRPRGAGGRRPVRATIRRGAMVLLVAVMATGPTFGAGDAETASLDVDVLLVVDTTSSVVAEDCNGDEPRLSCMRRDIGTLASSLAGSRFALMTFDSEAMLRVPFTTDATALMGAVDVLQQEVTFYSRGSSIDAPVEAMTELLDDAAEARPERTRVVLYLGDGEQTVDTRPGSFAPAARHVAGGAVIGYGTSRGGRMREHDIWFDDEGGRTPDYIPDNTTGEYPAPDARSRIDEDNLRHVARQLGVDYVHRDRPEDLDEVVAQVRRTAANARTEPGTSDDDPTRTGRSLVPHLAVALAMLALLELVALVYALAAAPRIRARGGNQGAVR